jgi:hypothetical protein
MTPSDRVVPYAAGSVLVRDLLAGPVRAAPVVAAGPAATYLDVGGRLLAVVQPGGVHLPCAVVLTGTRSYPREPGPAGASGVAAAASFAVGGGAVHRDGRPVAVVTRWFDPRVRLGPIDPVAVERLDALVRSRERTDALLPAGAAERLGDGLDRGDDLVAGALAALRAQASPRADDLAAAVRSLAPVRTTRLSGALLAAADVGAVIPEAADVLRALARHGEPPGRDHRPGALEAAVDRLVGVGHTSGWHLAAGLLAGLGLVRRSARTLVRSAS